jgi:signal transduction histidine kinase
MDLQIKETSQLTGALWAAWLERSGGWEILSSYKLNLQQRDNLLRYIEQGIVKGWFDGALTGKRGRSRSVAEEENLLCTKLYVFPDQMTQRVILVGANELSEPAQRFWRVVSAGNSGQTLLNPPTAPLAMDANLSIPYHLPKALNISLDMILRTAGCKNGWLSVRSGDNFEIKAHMNCADSANTRISIESSSILRDVIQNGGTRLVEKTSPEWKMVPRLGITPEITVWACLPLMIGQRMIGLVAIWQEEPFNPEKWLRTKQLVERIGPSVEASITFADLSQHLHRLALLNDFAMTISSALEPEQIAQRTFALLRRAFGTERINLAVLSSDGEGYQLYSEQDGVIILKTVPLEEAPILWAIARGAAYRLEELTSESDYVVVYPGSQSALIVPLKYRRQVIGALGLESNRVGAFTVNDEHLLVVIASYLTGLLENGRLRREAEDRARNLSLIHAVVEQVIGLTDVKEVAQIAAELLARNFAYELAVVALIRGSETIPEITGIGGSVAAKVQQGLKRMDVASDEGIVNRVAATGRSILVNDVQQYPIYRPIPDWYAGSEMCVALKDGNRVIGAIDVESGRKNAFTQNDLLVLESLAGILSNVITGAGQYQQLEATVDQLRATREELQERIAAQRSAESRLIQAAKLAAVGEMAAGIAHELNNPLTTVSGFSELVIGELPADSSQRTDMELVLREANRARGVVRRLLDFARQSESVRGRTDLNEIVADVLALVTHLLHTNSISISTDLTEGLPWIMVDRNQIKQVVLNLIHNALHAMPSGGTLLVSTGNRRRDKRNWVVVQVRDSGMGISPENIERVFEPFFTTRSNDGGTGLGLSVSYGIIVDHGGFIDVDSKVGSGSTFNVWFPVEVE